MIFETYNISKKLSASGPVTERGGYQRVKNTVFLLAFVILLAIPASSGQEQQKPLIIIYSPKVPNFGQELQRQIEEDGRVDAEIIILESPEFFNLMMHYPRVKVAIVVLNQNLNQDIGLTLDRFFYKGGGLVGLGFAGSGPATGPASEKVFPVFATSYISGEFDRATRSFLITHIKEDDDEISQGVSDFMVSDSKLVLSCDPASKEYVPKTPKTGEYKVLFRENKTGAPSVIKYRKEGASVIFSCFAGDDQESGAGYFGRFTGTTEFRELFTNAVYWVWANEEKYDESMSMAAGYKGRQDEIQEIREKAEKRDQEEANAWMLQMVLTLSLSAVAIFGVYWFTFVKSPKSG